MVAVVELCVFRRIMGCAAEVHLVTNSLCSRSINTCIILI